MCRTEVRNWACLVSSGRWLGKVWYPASREDFRLLRTDTPEAASCPTCTTASPGRRPWRAAKAAARAATAARTLAATILPSSSTAPPAVRTAAGAGNVVAAPETLVAGLLSRGNDSAFKGPDRPRP